MAAEKQFENKIKEILHIRRAWRVKFFANAFTSAGIPDILVCYPMGGKNAEPIGRFMGIEVKGGSSYGLTELQKFNLKKIRDAGGIGICVYPSGWQQFLSLLDRLDAGEQVVVTDDNYILK